jgi:hypothetical protein
MLCGCFFPQSEQPKLIGSQHLYCDRLFNPKGELVDEIETPAGFSVTPAEAIRLAEKKTNLKCHHKWGTSLYADRNYYYLMRPGTGVTLNLNKSIRLLKAVVDGTDGAVWEIRRGK